MKPPKRRPWKHKVPTRFDRLRWLRQDIIYLLEGRRRWDEDIFRRLEDGGAIDRKIIEHVLQNLLMVDAIKESRKGKYRYFELVKKPYELFDRNTLVPFQQARTKDADEHG